MSDLTVREIAQKLDVSTTRIYALGIKDSMTQDQIALKLSAWRSKLYKDAESRVERARLVELVMVEISPVKAETTPYTDGYFGDGGVEIKAKCPHYQCGEGSTRYFDSKEDFPACIQFDCWNCGRPFWAEVAQ